MMSTYAGTVARGARHLPCVPVQRSSLGKATMTGLEAGVLVRAAQGGDRSAWNAIVDRYAALLWGVARAHRLGQADAADVVQTTWLRLVEHLDTIEEPDRLAGWLATTARRECLRVLRHTGRELVGSLDDAATDVVDELAPALDAALLEQDRDRALWSCFQRLSERCQHLLRVLMVTERPAYAEVSEALGMPIGSIGPTRMRCLERLRTITHEAGYTDDLHDGSA